MNIIVFFIVVCAIAVAAIIFKKQAKIVVSVGLNAIVGMAAAFFINFAAAPLEAGIGINFINALFVGVLGLPGLVTLYVAAWVL